MEITVRGEAKEIAALVLAVQERRLELQFDPDVIAQAICDKNQEAQEQS